MKKEYKPKLTKKSKRVYKNGGYVEEEVFDNGAITALSMDAKGFYEEFAKPLFKKLQK